MRRILYENSLSLAFLALFILALVGQSLTGHRQYNEERQEHGQPSVTYGQYLRTGNFWEAVTENWESEFLQMGVYVLLTAFLRQKGSPESKKLAGEEAVDRDPRNKETSVVRLVDRARRTLVYLAFSTKVVEGSPFNSISSVPVMPWQG